MMTVFIGKKSEAWTLHDSNEIDLNHGFIPDADGNFEGRLRYDSTDRTIFVKGGVFYPLDIKLAKSTGATGVAEITVIRAREAQQTKLDDL